MVVRQARIRTRSAAGEFRYQATQATMTKPAPQNGSTMLTSRRTVPTIHSANMASMITSRFVSNVCISGDMIFNSLMRPVGFTRLHDVPTGSATRTTRRRRVAKQFGDGQKEHPPAVQPAARCVCAINRCQNRQHVVAVGVQVGEPGFGRSLVMSAAPRILLRHRQGAIELVQEVGARHDAAGEKVASHPIRRAVRLERIRQAAMAENVNEQLSVRSEPRRDALQQTIVVAHVLKHLHRDDAVEC